MPARHIIYNNDRLCRLLAIRDADALSRPNLTDDKKWEILYDPDKKLVCNTPKVKVNAERPIYLLIQFSNFTPSSNPQYRNNLLMIHIYCHFDNWELENGMQRPLRIAAELDTMLSTYKLSGMGKLQFMGADSIVAENEESFGGFTLVYAALHGGEDKKQFSNVYDEIEFLTEELGKKE